MNVEVDTLHHLPESYHTAPLKTNPRADDGFLDRFRPNSAFGKVCHADVAGGKGDDEAVGADRCVDQHQS